MLYHGLVQVPDDAVAGSAILSVCLQKDSEFKSNATEIKVKLLGDSKSENTEDE